MNKGFVSLVGAGPGDPELLTLKALRRLREAEVVMYDALVNPALLEHCQPQALPIYVGKRCGRHSMAQTAINQILVAQGRAGRRVVRLKGGDPFIFGRGAEEAEALEAAGVAWEVVPGISSAIAAPAYAGIPLTHRDLASSCAFVTGHEALNGNPAVNRASGMAADTLVILMGVERIRQITARLIETGWDAATPAALVHWGTTEQQQTVVATLDMLSETVERLGLAAPAVIVVGAVVTCATRLQWFRGTEERFVAAEKVVTPLIS